MNNPRIRRLIAVLVMCVLAFTLGTIATATATSDTTDTSASQAADSTDSTAALTGTLSEAPDANAGEAADTATDGADDAAAADTAEEETAEEEAQPKFYATLLALLPPVIAIVLALITKEVYSSLFIGIVVGGLLYSNFNFEGTVVHVLSDGFVSSLADKYNMGILLFLIVLGSLVAMMNKSGGSAAFGRWASKRIKTRVGAQLATIILGILIFVDDYFNCLTVGSVMRPVTDKHNVSRAKLAYLIDATAAPVCIIAPISSWAAAVAGFVAEEEVSGFNLFLRAIPYNFYALLTIVFMIAITVMKTDYGPMRLHEANALKGDLFTSDSESFKSQLDENANPKGKVIDLVLPVVVLIISCVIGMIYSGGFFSGTNLLEAFANCDASVGLVYGSFITLIFTIIYYLLRRVISFKNCIGSIPEGFKSMVPAIMILACAWTLKAMTDSLGAKEYIEGIVKASAGNFENFLPAIVFLIAVGLSFATGTSWGTFGILIPIVLSVVPYSSGEISIIAISACMAGAVCGDHCSPISDTTIMASAGSNSNHINHVSTQLPYAMTVAGISFLTYIIAGFSRNVWISLPSGIAITILVLIIIKLVEKSRGEYVPKAKTEKKAKSVK